jgi:hypothetical protein
MKIVPLKSKQENTNTNGAGKKTKNQKHQYV